MEKLTEIIYVEPKIEFNAEYFYSAKYVDKNNSIDSILEWLKDLKKHGATHIKWNAVAYDGESDHVGANGFYVKTETDSEYEERIRLMEEQSKIIKEKNIKAQEKRERSEYLRLKRKFEKG